RAAFPARVRAAVVTGETRPVDLRGRHLFELSDVPLRLVVDVRLSRTVAALAPVGRFWRARVLRLTVRRTLERVSLVGVTRDARVAADVPPLRRCRWFGLRCRWLRLRCGCL